MLSNKDKKYLLDEFLRHISHIQDKDYQKRIWIRNKGPESQAFDDAVCDFFDIGEPILDNYKSFNLTNNQHELLIKLRDAFEIFSDQNDRPEEFIDTLEWERIMNLAKEVLKAFNYQKD